MLYNVTSCWLYLKNTLKMHGHMNVKIKIQYCPYNVASPPQPTPLPPKKSSVNTHYVQLLLFAAQMHGGNVDSTQVDSLV